MVGIVKAMSEFILVILRTTVRGVLPLGFVQISMVSISPGFFVFFFCLVSPAGKFSLGFST